MKKVKKIKKLAIKKVTLQDLDEPKLNAVAGGYLHAARRHLWNMCRPNRLHLWNPVQRPRLRVESCRNDC